MLDTGREGLHGRQDSRDVHAVRLVAAGFAVQARRAGGAGRATQAGDVWCVRAGGRWAGGARWAWCARTRSVPRRSRVMAPRALPRLACVRPTAIWARPCHRSRSPGGPVFQAASRTSCAWNGRPSRSSRSARTAASRPVMTRLSGILSWPVSARCWPASRASGRPRPSRGRAFLGRPDGSRSRSLLKVRGARPVTVRVRGRRASRAARCRGSRAVPRGGSGRRRR